MTDIQRFAAVVLRVTRLVYEASDAQWQAGKSPVPREDTTERSKGMTSDPTPTIVADDRRLKLRLEVLKATHALNAATTELETVETRLTHALTDHQG